MQNTDSFTNNGQYRVLKQEKNGPIISTFNVSSTTSSNDRYQSEEGLDAIIPSFSLEINLDDINGMNLILNDSDCSDTFFQDVINQLREDGVQLTITRGGNGINENDVTIVTLDQQYSAGPGTIIFAPYDNTRVGQSDSLALAMQAAFKQNGLLVDDIVCGQTGYRQMEDGSIQSFFPTSTEEKVDEGYDSSFVTISLGTECQNAVLVAKSIENGLARHNYHLKSDDSATDLIYRANSSDTLENVANYFGTDSQQIKNTNHMIDVTFSDSQAVINPSIENMNAFDSTGDFRIRDIKTRTY